MKTWQAILVTLGLIVVMVLLPPIPGFLMLLGTSIWAALDSKKIELYKYDSRIALKPFCLFVGCLMMWIIGFPWYLSMRYKIKNGLAQMRDEYLAAEN